MVIPLFEHNGLVKQVGQMNIKASPIKWNAR